MQANSSGDGVGALSNAVASAIVAAHKQASSPAERNKKLSDEDESARRSTLSKKVAQHIVLESSKMLNHSVLPSLPTTIQGVTSRRIFPASNQISVTQKANPPLISSETESSSALKQSVTPSSHLQSDAPDTHTSKILNQHKSNQCNSVSDIALSTSSSSKLLHRIAEPISAINHKVIFTAKQRVQLAVQVHTIRFILMEEEVPNVLKKALKSVMPSQAKELSRHHHDGLRAAQSISDSIPSISHYLTQILCSRFSPAKLKQQFILRERDRYIDDIVSRKLRKDKTKEIDEDSLLSKKKLRVLSLQRHVRQKVGSVFTLVEIEKCKFKIEKQVEYEIRAREKQERRDRLVDEKASRRERKLFLSAVINHHISFIKHHRDVLRIRKRLATACAKNLQERSQAKQALERQAARTRMKALRDHDEVEYIRLVKEAKNERLMLILRETGSYMRSLGAEIAKERKDDSAMKTCENDDFGGGSHEFFRLTHSVQQSLSHQPHMLQHGTLRSYQMTGLNWLVSLHNNNLNGILADEMGLGKTIQTISLIAHLIETKHINGPFLIVAPMSTIWNNWAAEFDRWLPDVKKVVYDGHKDRRRRLRQHELFTGDYSVVMTTFDFVMRDKRWLQKINWELLVVDEAHRLKNSNCKLATTLSRYYTSRSRLALTGTPLQNRLPELWSLLNFLHPKVFNASTDFERWFSGPLSSLTSGSSLDTCDSSLQLTDEEQMLIIDRLHSVLRPFMLRRLKSEVEKDLPEKVERVLRCELSPLQRFMYQAIVDKEVSVHNRVMQLRKVCNHPLLFHPRSRERLCADDIDEDSLIMSSAKVALLERILPKLQVTGHRVLMFFQMTRMMDIFEIYLRRRNFLFLRLDGTTSADERANNINLFQAPNSSYFIFMLSTKAGGVGINLQSADTVIIYDSDWNPQNDMQALARSHRIGQKHQVLVIRFVTTGTVEETVSQRAANKLDAEAMVIQAGMFHQQYRKETSQKIIAAVLRDQDDLVEMDDDDADEDEVSSTIARSEAELETFCAMDNTLPQTFPPSSHEAPPEWAIHWWESASRKHFDKAAFLSDAVVSDRNSETQSLSCSRLTTPGASPSDTNVDGECGPVVINGKTQRVAPLRLRLLPRKPQDKKLFITLKIGGVIVQQNLLAILPG